jgi:ABC-type multidrug transport system ATPase subunit
MLEVRELTLLNGKSINLKAHAGDLILLKGANGVGKSLFLKTLARLIPSVSGEIFFKEKKSSDHKVEQWRSKILYLGPEVSFSDEETLEDFLSLPFGFEHYKNFTPSFDPRSELKNLGGLVRDLSSGQKQRLALLRALSLDSEVLLLDESLGHMDEEARGEMLDKLEKYLREGKVIILVSHFDLGLEESSSLMVKSTSLF